MSLRKRIETIRRVLSAQKDSDGFPGYPRSDEDLKPGSDWSNKADAWAFGNYGRPWSEVLEYAIRELEQEFPDLD